jgi:hypothetical protein
VYRSAPNLAALIESLAAQTSARSHILLATSTPSPELEHFARSRALPLHVNPQRIDIATDWNFALEAAETQYVTLAHQDDLFARDYVSRLTATLRRHPDALFAFCDYSEHTPRAARPVNVNLRIKRALRWRAFGQRECLEAPREKLRLLSLGNPVCCPSVMFNRSALGDFRFPSGFQTNLDWMAWIELARRPGAFVYVPGQLVSKGVHPGSETTATIANRAREREDRAIFDLMWPRPVAAAIAALYRLSYRANRVEGSGLAEADAHHPERDHDDPDPLQG